MELEIFKMLEPYGLPGLVIAAILAAYYFGPDRKAQEPAQQIVDAVNAMRAEISGVKDVVREVRAEVREVKDDMTDLKDQTIDRLARVETEVKNLKERK